MYEAFIGGLTGLTAGFAALYLREQLRAPCFGES